MVERSEFIIRCSMFNVRCWTFKKCFTLPQTSIFYSRRNGRSYPDAVLSNEALRFTNEIVKENRGFGELGHPQGPSINLDRVAIIIKEINKNGTQFMGKALVTETPMGQIVKGLLEGEAKLGVSSRALGSLKEEDHVMIVQPDLKLIIHFLLYHSKPSQTHLLPYF